MRFALKEQQLWGKLKRVPSDISVYLPACGCSQRNTFSVCWRNSDRYTAAFRENRAETRRNWHRTSSFSGNICVYVDFSSFTNPKLCISLHCRTQKNNTRFTFMHLVGAFIQSDLRAFRLYIFCQYMCSLGIEPTTFVLLTQCSTTEPQEHRRTTLKHYFIIWWWQTFMFRWSILPYHIHRSWLDIVRTNDWNNINITNITLTSMFRTC